ncbi:MAG: MFS transporter [Phycisphaerales bacterium]|nr:MFS transporter [Phycisphaerales bacterium]
MERKGRAGIWLATILPFGLGFQLTVCYRTINAILAQPIMADLDLDSGQIGLATSTFALAFAAAQIPLGLLLDGWGARRTQTVLFLVGAGGAAVIGSAHGLTTLALGGALLGVGMAGGLMAAFESIAERVEARQVPFFNSIILAVGGLGALVATSPAKAFESAHGWRALMFVLAGATVACAVLVFAVHRDVRHPEDAEHGLRERLRGLRRVVRDRSFWRVVPLLAATYGGFMGMQGLWLGPWLRHVVGVSPEIAAEYLSVLAMATIVGFLSDTFISRIAEVTGIGLATILAVASGLHVVTQVMLVLDIGSTHLATWFVYGYLAQMPILYFAVVTQHLERKVRGRALTAANILVFLFMFGVQFGFGSIVHAWPKLVDGGTVVSSYRAGMLVLIAIQAAALAWFVLFRPRHATERERADGAR